MNNLIFFLTYQVKLIKIYIIYVKYKTYDVNIFFKKSNLNKFKVARISLRILI